MIVEPRGPERATTACFVGVKPAVVGPLASGYSWSLFHAARPSYQPWAGLSIAWFPGSLECLVSGQQKPGA